MNRREFLRSLSEGMAVLGLSNCLLAPSPGTEAPGRPSIVFIMADDLGWGDVGYHGSEIETPNIDRLAREGLRLEQHYVMPTCSPTRCSLMTGRYSSRFGLLSPTNHGVLEPNQATLAGVLRDQGYDTAIVGKWHLGSRPEWGPQQHGFAHSYGSLAGGLTPYTHRYKTGPFTRTWHRNGKQIEESGHVTDLLGAEAVRLIENWASPRKNFFLYVPFTAPHIPIHEPAHLMEQYEGKIADESRRRFAACVSHMDEEIGEILAALERTGQREDTIIVFTSDNGGQESWQWSDRYPQEEVPFQSSPRLGNNLPLAGWKGSLYEGGIRVPTLVNWPGVLKPGQTSAVMHIVDWMPTLCGFADFLQVRDLQWDGRDMWPVVADKRTQPVPRTLYWRTPTKAALREGDWKLILDMNRPENEELYNLADDPYERQNLAADRPRMVTCLRELLQLQRTKDSEDVFALTSDGTTLTW